MRRSPRHVTNSSRNARNRRSDCERWTGSSHLRDCLATACRCRDWDLLHQHPHQFGRDRARARRPRPYRYERLRTLSRVHRARPISAAGASQTGTSTVRRSEGRLAFGDGQHRASAGMPRSQPARVSRTAPGLVHRTSQRQARTGAAICREQMAEGSWRGGNWRPKSLAPAPTKISSERNRLFIGSSRGASGPIDGRQSGGPRAQGDIQLRSASAGLAGAACY
jgi:hypothetical protein